MYYMDLQTIYIFRCLTPLCVLIWINKGAADIQPTFTNTPLIVTVLKGSEAVLRCGVDHLGTKTVGWRKQPYNVPITIGKEQFLELDRFKLVRILHAGEWNLHIKNAQTFDSGIYECQVSSRDNLMRRNVTLTVYVFSSLPSPFFTNTELVMAQTFDSGIYECQVSSGDNLMRRNVSLTVYGIYECQVSSRDNLMRRNVTLTVYDDTDNSHKPNISISGTQFVEKGTSIHLTCNVTSRSTSRHNLPKYLGWFKDGRRLETSSSDDIYITQHVSSNEQTVISAVDILKARMTDTGVYVCLAAKDLATRIKVDVLNAETYNEKRETRMGDSLVQESNKASCFLSINLNSLRVLLFSIIICKIILRVFGT